MANGEGQGKLSQQRAATQQTSRPTRTQRLQQQAEVRKQRAEFDELQKRAKQVQQEKFSNLRSVEDYETQYNQLDPELVPFFATPQQVQADKDKRIEDNKILVNNRLSYADVQIAKLEQEYKDDVEYYRRKRSEAKSDKDRDRYREQERRAEDDYDEERKYWLGYKKGLKEGLGKLNSGKDLSFSDIENYADDLGDYEERREEAKNRQQKAEREQRKKIDEAIKEAQLEGGRFERVTESKNGVVQGQKIYAISPSGKYTLISQAKPTANLSKIAQPSQLGKAKVSQVYSVGNVKLTFSGTEQLYTTKSGQLATAFGELGRSEADVLNSQRIADEQAKKQREQEAAAFLGEQGFEQKVSAPAKDERTIAQKGFDYIKALYGTTIFGTSLKMPDEYLEKRKPVSFFGIGNSAVGVGGTTIYGLDFKTSLEGVEAERRKKKEAEEQAELIGELGLLTEQAPEEIQYEVQQKGIDILGQRGVEATFDDKTGLIKFTSGALKPSKSYNIYEYEKAKAFDERNLDKPYVFKFDTPERKENISLPFQTRGTAIYDPSTKSYKAPTTEVTIPAKSTTISPATVGVGLRIAGTKALEFYLVGKGIGAVAGGIGKGAKGLYSGLGGGLRITDATVRGGTVYASVTQSTIVGGRTAQILKATGTGALFVAGAGLYTAGKIQQKKQYEAAYGDVGADVFKYETIGELAGLGILLGESAYKSAQQRRINEEIARKNYERQLKAQRLRNIRDYGQYSQYAKVSYQGAGRGQKLTEAQAKELAKLYAEATGVSKAKATTLVKEGALYRQTLRVGSPAGFKPYVTDKYALVSSTKTASGSRELAFEFTKRGSRLQNIIIKTTTGKGRYALTSVFEKARYTPLQPDKNLRLQKTIISKIVKSRGTQIGSQTIRGFDVENRLVQSYPYGKERLQVGEALKLGLPKYAEKDLAAIFKKAGVSARTSALPIKNLRIEQPFFRDVGGGLKVAREGQYQFIQAGKGGRQVALKNILRDIDFKQLETVLRANRRRTPLSVTFGSQVPTQQQTLSALTKGGSAAVSKSAGQQVAQTTVKNVAISPSVQADLKIRITEKLLTGVSTSSAQSQAPALTSALAGALGLRSKQQLKSELRAKQVTQQVQQLRVAQDTQQVQAQQSRQIAPNVPTFPDPTISIREIIPTTTTTTRVPPTRPAAIVLPNIERLLRERRARKGEKGVDVDFLLPDFATRILGLSPEVVGSEKDALREIRRIKTGLELRRGLVIRN